MQHIVLQGLWANLLGDLVSGLWSDGFFPYLDLGVTGFFVPGFGSDGFLLYLDLGVTGFFCTWIWE